MSIEEGLATLEISDVQIDQSKYLKYSLKDISAEQIGQKISTFGWITKSVALKNVGFIDLTSQFSTIKCVIPASKQFIVNTTLTIYGTVKKNNSTRDSHEFEVVIEAYSIYNGVQAPPFPLNQHSEKEKLLDYAHLALRLKERSLFLEARSQLLRCCREFYWSKDYCEITPPTLVQTQVEGGSTLFTLDFYGEKAYLTQSSQLYLETVAPVAGKAFCIMPSYRAEKSKTSRHLSEYTHVEAELVDITFGDLMDSIEQLVKSVIKGFYSVFLEKLHRVYPGFEPVAISDEPFKRLTHADAIKFLMEKKHLKPDQTPYAEGDDIADASERFIVEEYGKGQPVFLIRFPVDHKPFYVKKDSEGTQSCDLLFPGIGEIVGGSMRADKYEELKNGFMREGIDPSPYYWYLDMAKFGPALKGGYGLGFERLMMGVMRYSNVDQATLYPRKVGRCTP